jgi:predicted membrane chloride channel (bestrophin family)
MQMGMSLISANISMAYHKQYISEEMAHYGENLIAKELMAVLGTCSRINSTPLNFAVAIHVRTVLLLYFAVLPIFMISNGINPGFQVAIMYHGY